MNFLIAFIFVMFYNVNAYLYGDRLNVGSILFKQSDLNKKCWDAAAIDLLEARKYLQNILPSPDVVDAVNDEYLEHLLQYFDNSYDTVKRETDPAIRNVIKYALSDAIGGYLKAWVLPVSKYSYYGGTISLDNVLRVTKVYDDIKRELNTDGEGWRKDEELISYFPIDVAKSDRRYSRFHEGTCDDLAYYEKSDSGYSVPVPVINWDICPSTMFIPLKNPSLVPLESTNCLTSLVNYYDLIQNCVNNIDNWKDFDDRFQSWLLTDVTPHLDDDCLYVPFGGVLGLMNHSKFPGNFFRTLKSGYKKVANSCKPDTFFFFSGKKVIIAIIIFIEFVWCIPALYYFICCKNKKRKRRWSLLFCFKRNNKKNAFYLGTSTDDDSDYSERHYLSSSSDRTYNTINDLQPSVYGTRHSIDSESQNDSTNFFHQQISYIENQHSESKPLVKFQSNSKPRDIVKTECEVDKKRSLKKSNSRQSRKSKHSTQSSEKVLQNFNYSQYLMKTTKDVSAGHTVESHDTCAGQYSNIPAPFVSQNIQKDAHKPTVVPHKENSKTYPCTSNLKNDAIHGENNKLPIARKKKEKRIFRIRRRTTEVRREERAGKNNTNCIRKEAAPALQINIARPETEIKVDISRYKEYTKRNVRPSKIPRLNAAGIKEVANENASVPPKRLPPNWRKAEETVLNYGGIEIEENDTEKLNATL